MLDAFSPNFSLDGLGLELGSVGRCDPTRANPSPPPMALPLAFSENAHRRQRTLSRATPRVHVLRAESDLDSLTPCLSRRSPINGGLDMMFQNEHWRCVSWYPSRPFRIHVIGIVPAPPPAPYFFLSRWISTRHLSTRDVPDGTLPTPPLHSLEEDKHFENTLAQLGEVDGEDPFMQVSPRPSIPRDTFFFVLSSISDL